MNTTILRRLEDVRLADAAEVGGKAASLGELIAGGAHVPPGVVIAASAAGSAADARATLLREAMGALGPGPFAVRSSGIAEDGMDRSFAGMYETVLDVAPDDVGPAADRVIASANATRIAAYEPAAGAGAVAVLVQRMVQPAAAGVALTADPISGDRRTTVVTAVRGAGERLVSGAAAGDEWSVRDGTAVPRRNPERAIDGAQAMAVAAEARRVAEQRGAPQDVEWAIDADGALWILQARPMTALPPEVSWTPPAPGAFTRQYRLAEWIGAPVTPLFESWLLTTMEERMHAFFFEQIGQRAPQPLHVVVNGWYFYSMNWAAPAAMLRNLPRMLWHLARNPRAVAGVNPSTVRHSFRLLERMWRADFRPRYRSAIDRAEARVEAAPVDELPGLIDEMAGLAGEAFGWLAALAGAAYKMELNLAGFYQRHVRPSLGGSHLPLLTGFALPAGENTDAVTSLDWFYPVATTSAPPAADLARLVDARHVAEEAAFRVLASSPRRLAAFRRLLADAQYLVPLREEQVAELTMPWPIMRRAVLRIGEELLARGLIDAADDIFFLTRTEALAALTAGRLGESVSVDERRATREEQARLVPPLLIGHVHPVLRRMLDSMTRTVGAEPSRSALVTGTPASPGRASGAVRVVHRPDEFDEFQPGDILVAPMTAPAWTPLFTRAAAVVTDVGSAAAHASIIAREYGIPAVVGCGDATARLRDGMRVTVDGGTGNVEPE
ncbi:MAG TPA: PEP/pyruvate-binding domain-containing protein [Candidatus Limnocylindria bacterium]|nr:PEP/pyruvate-binding domain-containing protein [Candidatus Limnocylindria bacterium]